MNANNPRVFDTEVPASYGSDYPMLPEADPFAGFNQTSAPPLDILSEAQKLFDFQNSTMTVTPAQNPGTYNPNESYQLTEERQHLSSPDSPVPGDSGLVLGDLSHPALYRASEATRLFDIENSAGITVQPFIPTPATVFEKPARPRFQYGPFRFSMEVDSSLATISNVFGTATNPKRDSAYSFDPKIYIEAGTRGFMSMYYEPSFLRYAKYSTMNTNNQIAAFTVRYPFTKLQIGGDAFYSTQSGLFINSQTTGHQATYLARLFASYPITPKTNGLFFYEGSVQDSDPGGRKLENSVDFVMTHSFSTAISYGGSLKIGDTSSSTANDAYTTLQAQFTFIPEYHFQFRGELGVQVRHFSAPAGGSSMLQTPVFDLTGSYHLTSNTAFILRFYRLVNDNTFANVNAGIETSFEASLVLRLLDKTDFTMKATAGHVEQLSTTDPIKSDFNYFQGGVKISYTIINAVDLILFDNIQKRFADSLGGDYISNTAGMAVTLRF